MENRKATLRAGLLAVDFSNAGATLEEIQENLPRELDRIQKQLKPGYVFESDKALPLEKRESVENFTTKDGIPTFQAYRPDTRGIVEAARKIMNKYGNPRNIIVVGNGGSVKSAKAFYDALVRLSDLEKRLFVLDTIDPDQIAYLKKKFGPKDTLVVAVSKSGDTQGVLDAFDQFIGEYSLAAVTTKPKPEDSPETLKKRRLYHKVKEALNAKGLGEHAEEMIIDHPPVGGRYSGRTPAGILPLALLGVSERELKALDEGARKTYKQIESKVHADRNPALMLAAALYYLEKTRGYTKIFAPMYGQRLEGFGQLITQILHESSGKNGRGQIILASAGPECQHHTNQLLFGGPKDMACVFFTITKPRETKLKASDGVPLQKALQFEYEGTRDNATEEGISNITVSVDEINPESVGAMLAFIHYAFGVYPSLLRDVNPFDQPQVERSKEISRELRRRRLSL